MRLLAAARPARFWCWRAMGLGIWIVVLPSFACPAAARAACDAPTSGVTVVECALAASPALRREEQEIRVLAGERLRASTLLPAHPVAQVSFAGRRARGGTSAGEPPTTLNWYVTLSQEIEIAGQRGARLRATDAAIGAEQRRIVVAAQEVASAALGTYYELLAATEAAALGREVAGIAEQLAGVAAARADVALLAPVDAQVAQAEAVRLYALRYEAERRVEDLQVSLSAQLGQQNLTTVQGTLDALPGNAGRADEDEALVAQALLLRADLGAARREQEVRAAATEVLRRARVPNLTLSFMAQRDGFDEQVFGGGLTLPLALPAPLGPSRAGELAAAAAQVVQAGLTVEELQRRVRTEVLRALRRERSYRDQLRRFPTELAARARTDLAALTQAITARQLAPRDALLAQRSLVELLLGFVEVRRGLALARIERLRAAGQPLLPVAAGGQP